jgi:hypothetical protein
MFVDLMAIFKHYAWYRNILKNLLRLSANRDSNEQHIQAMLKLINSWLGVCSTK